MDKTERQVREKEMVSHVEAWKTSDLSVSLRSDTYCAEA